MYSKLARSTLATLAIAWPLAAFAGDVHEQSGSVERPRDMIGEADADSQVTAGEVASSPERFYGRRIKVRAEVEDVYNAHAFTLDEDELFAGPDLLVLNPAPQRKSADDEEVTVTGVVRHYSPSEMQRDFSWFDPGWLAGNIDFSARPVLIADSVRTLEGQELVQTGEPATRAGDQPLDQPEHGEKGKHHTFEGPKGTDGFRAPQPGPEQ